MKERNKKIPHSQLRAKFNAHFFDKELLVVTSPYLHHRN